MTGERTIVVGVGPGEVRSALDFAVDEAVRTGSGLHLVHAMHVVRVGPEAMLVAAVDVEEVERASREVLDLALEHADRLVGGSVRLTHAVVRGTPVQVLVEAGRAARMVVLEHRHLSRLARVVNRTVAGGVAAHLRAPVVAVPTGWRRETATGVVVAGVDVPERSDEVLGAAASEARSRGARLRVVHAWPVPPAYRDLVTEGDHGRWAGAARAELHAALDRLGDESLATDTELRVQIGRPIEALLGASEGADLLVVGRHDPLVPIGSHVGPVARAVLREATCPVLLAEPHHGRGRAAPDRHISGRGGF